MGRREVGFIRSVRIHRSADGDVRLAPALTQVDELALDPSVTFLVGPNGSGKSTLLRLLAGELPAPPISETLDFLLIEVEHGRALFQGRPQRKHYNPLGTVHGGWFATILDSCMGCAVHTTMPAGRAYTTAELKINIVRPLSDRVPLVRAEGRVIHEGRRMATADGRLFGADGKLYAHGSTTCFVYDAAGP